MLAECILIIPITILAPSVDLYIRQFTKSQLTLVLISKEIKVD